MLQVWCLLPPTSDQFGLASAKVKKDYVRGFKRSGVYAMDWAGQPLVRPPLVRPAGPVKPEVTSSWSQRKKAWEPDGSGSQRFVCSGGVTWMESDDVWHGS